MVPRAGFEHATTRSSAERSPGLSYLGTQSWDMRPQILGGYLVCVMATYLRFRIFLKMRLATKKNGSYGIGCFFS